MYTRILVPLDGSELAERALPQAQSLAKAFGASIHLLQVVSRQPELGVAREMARQILEDQIPKVQEYLRRVAMQLEVGDIYVETAIREGAADEKILEYAQKERVDLITMSTHGYGGMKRLMLGSVTDRVIRSSHVPVLVLPP